MSTRRLKTRPHAVPLQARNVQQAQADYAPVRLRYTWTNPLLFARQIFCSHEWRSSYVEPVGGAPGFSVACCPRCKLTGHD